MKGTPDEIRPRTLRAAGGDGGGFSFTSWTELSRDARARVRAADVHKPHVPFIEQVAAIFILIGLVPVMAIIAVVIKLESPQAPVIYKQERVGLDRRGILGVKPMRGGHSERRKNRGFGKAFFVYKFRTMIPDAEKTTGPVWAQERDPRITSIGRVLRKLRLDEIPQIFNVIRGEMRLIGPRPERPHFVEKLTIDIPEYPERHRIPPGITGLAQVEREYDATVDDVRKKVKYDLFYVRNQSSLLNIKILMKTIVVAIRGRGAR